MLKRNLKTDKYHRVFQLRFDIFAINKKSSIMDVIYVMIGVSVIIAILFLVIFIKSVKTGQYDDMYTPSVRMLFEDELVKDKKEN